VRSGGAAGALLGKTLGLVLVVERCSFECGKSTKMVEVDRMMMLKVMKKTASNDAPVAVKVALTLGFSVPNTS
jgi:hypothetical protein